MEACQLDVANGAVRIRSRCSNSIRFPNNSHPQWRSLVDYNRQDVLITAVWLNITGTRVRVFCQGGCTRIWRSKRQCTTHRVLRYKTESRTAFEYPYRETPSGTI